MDRLAQLKSATRLHDVANILGFKPKALAYILYKKPPALKYRQFQIPKRSGGTRTINAPYPELMNLQRRLSKLLQSSVTEINRKRNITDAHATRLVRNELVHGRWGIDHMKSQVVNVVGLPTSPNQRQIRYTIPELKNALKQMETLQLQLIELRRQWPV